MSLSKRTRFKVFDRDDYKCRYCGKTPEDGVTLEADHIQPLSKGGSDDMENLVTSCMDCNRGKSNLEIGGNHEEPASVRMKRLQELAESKRFISEKKAIEKQRKKECQEWVNTICQSFGCAECPSTLAANCVRLSREFGAGAVIDWIERISAKFNNPDDNSAKYLNGIARKVREELTR